MSTLEVPLSPRLTNVLFRITADQYHEMIEAGIVPEDSSTELLEGIIVFKDRSDCPEDPMSHGPQHRLAVWLLTKLAAQIDSPERHFQVQLPVHLTPFDEPEPDGAIVIGAGRQFSQNLPAAADIACVIEVAHSSLDRDSEDKHAKYAGADIPQYVIVNLRDSQIETYSSPDIAEKRYQTKEVAAAGAEIRLYLGNGEFLKVAAADLLP